MKKQIIIGIIGFILVYLFIVISGCGGGSSTINPGPFPTSNPTSIPTSQIPTATPWPVGNLTVHTNMPGKWIVMQAFFQSGKVTSSDLIESDYNPHQEQALDGSGNAVFNNIPLNSNVVIQIYNDSNKNTLLASTNTNFTGTATVNLNQNEITPTPTGVIAIPTELPPTPGPGQPTWTPSPSPTPQKTPLPGEPTWTPTTVIQPTNTPPPPTVGPGTPTATNTPTSTPTPEPAPNPVEDNSNFVSPLPGNAGGVCVDQSRNLGYTVVGFEITQFNITNGTIVGSTNEGIVTGGFIDVTVNEVTGNFYGLTGSKIYEFDSSRNKLNTYSLGITDSRGIAIINGNVYFTDPNNNRISFRPLSNLSAVSQYLATGQVPNCRDLNYDNNSNLHVCTSSGIKIINSSTGNVLSTYGPSAIDVVITGNFARVCVSSGFQIWNISTNLKVHDTPLSYGQGITYYEYSGQKYTLFRDDNGVGQVRRYKD